MPRELIKITAPNTAVFICNFGKIKNILNSLNPKLQALSKSLLREGPEFRNQRKTSMINLNQFRLTDS